MFEPGWVLKRTEEQIEERQVVISQGGGDDGAVARR